MINSNNTKTNTNNEDNNSNDIIWYNHIYTTHYIYIGSRRGGGPEVGPGRGLHGGAQRAAHSGDLRRHRGAMEQAAPGEEDDARG